MPNTMTSDQMRDRSQEPVVLDRVPQGGDAPPKEAPKQKPPAKPASARAAAGPPKKRKPAASRHKESVPVRVRKDDTDVYSIWNCAESPNERIRVGDDRVLQFRAGTLKCKTSGDDAAVELASQYAGGRYIRADEDLIDKPLVSELTNPPTYWYSRTAMKRHQEAWKRDHA